MNYLKAYCLLFLLITLLHCFFNVLFEVFFKFRIKEDYFLMILFYIRKKLNSTIHMQMNHWKVKVFEWAVSCQRLKKFSTAVEANR